MWLINLTISLFSIITTRALECVSVINQKCMPRPKVLDVNEGVGEALFYSYNVLVNKCSGSRDTLDNPMAKTCVPNIIKRINMKVYNFLMRLNETRNVLWHETCKYECKLNSSVCNNKQIWNSDTCRYDCNEDFAGIISWDKRYTWNPSTCECQCDMWCKPRQYLDHKNCICKNKLIGRLIKECTSVINETMINNKDNIDNDNTITYVFVGIFSVLYLLELFVFACLLILSGLKVKNYLKINILIIEHIKMDIKSLEIETKANHNWDDIVHINDIPKPYCLNITIKPLYFVIIRLFGYIEEINGSSDKYLVVAESVHNEKIISSLNMVWRLIKNKINPSNFNNRIEDYNKFRSNSDIDLPLDTIIEFRSLVINANCVIEKDGEYYPEIYLDEGFYIQD